MMHSLASDLRYAARELRRRPGFASTAILSLALGVGATSAVFSVVYAVLINPFPYVGAERMMQVALKLTDGNFRYPGFTGPQMARLRQTSAVESVVGEDGWNLTTTDGDLPEGTVREVDKLNTAKVPIHCVDLAGGLAGDDLKRIAEHNGGQYASRPGDLQGRP